MSWKWSAWLKISSAPESSKPASAHTTGAVPATGHGLGIAAQTGRYATTVTPPGGHVSSGPPVSPASPRHARPAFLLAGYQIIKPHMQHLGRPNQGVQGWWRRPCLVATDAFGNASHSKKTEQFSSRQGSGSMATSTNCDCQLTQRCACSLKPPCQRRQAAMRSHSTFKKQEITMRHLITAGLVAAALIAYSFGFESGSGILFVAGAIFEIVSIKRLRSLPRIETRPQPSISGRMK